MYCYFSEYKKNKLTLDLDFIQTKSDFLEDIFSLFTCNRVEFYSEDKIDFLEKDNNFIRLDKSQEIYNHFLKVVL
jgi:glutamyl-tRNA reductase